MTQISRSLRINEIQRVRSDLERDSFPRLQMLLLVSITGVAGFVASYTFLQAGFTDMWLRYLAAFVIAYLVFLLLLWLWLRTRAEDYTDVPDFSGSGSSHPNPSSSGSSDSCTCYSGKGGDFGGGGAGGDFHSSASGHVDLPTIDIPAFGDSGGSVGDALGAAAEAQEFAIPLIVLIIAGVLLLSSFFMIYSAPTLFAELLVDGVLSATLYRKLRCLETHHWLETAIRRTVWPFILTAAIVSASGWAMTLYAPEAHSIADVISHSRHGK